MYRVQNKPDFSETKNISIYLRISFQRVQKNRNFIVGIKRYVQLKILNSRYEFQALKNGNFANDLGFQRNHFCCIRDVKLLLGFKFHNFSSQYVSVAKENTFDQFHLILIDWKLAIFPTVSEFDETSFIRTVSSIRS